MLNYCKCLSVQLVSACTVALMLSDVPATAEEVAIPAPEYVAKSDATLEALCGKTNNLEHVEEYGGKPGVSKDYVKTHNPSTLQLQWLSATAIRQRLPQHNPGNISLKRWCTGTRIDREHVLTAGHCFDIIRNGHPSGWITPNRPSPGGDVYAQPKMLATLMQVNFNYQKNAATSKPRQEDSFPIIELREYREGSDKLDFAIIKIGKNKSGELPDMKKYPIAKLDLKKPAKNDNLAIIQHPNGEMKQVEAGTVDEFVGSYMLYSDLDTFPGSSGSGARNAKGVVIGVHTNGGCDQPVWNVGGKTFFGNGAVRNDAIAKASKLIKTFE